MKLTIRFFGKLAEITGKDHSTLAVDDGLSVEALKELMNKQYDSWQTQTYLVAVNQTIADKGELYDGDEVAFLPPFAGG
ncbi:MAG: MoaD/ThiS family protein [Cyclobacteriaceae bacterium]